MSIHSVRLTILLCCGAMMCLAIGVNLPPVFLTTFSETFGGAEGLSSEELGRIPAVIFAAMVSGIVITGPLADRFGVRLFVLIGLGFVMLGLAALCLAANYTTLLLAGIFLGFGTANLEVVLSPIVAAVQPDRRSSAMNHLHLFYCVGAVGTVLIGAGALHAGISWRIVSGAIIVFPLLIFMGFTKIQIPTKTHSNESPSSYRPLFKQPLVMAASLAIFLSGATEVGLAQWLPTYAERGLGYSKAVSGGALAAFSMAMGVGRYAVSRHVHRTGALPIMMGSCTVSAMLLLIGGFSPIEPIALAACVCVGFSVACLWPSTLAVAADAAPNGGASLFAVLAAAGNMGCIVMP
ncbi:MAG: MFS transporter [Candidatus Omnitrophica bacterium]|nr:MFS transporter [Candidatus Omnitrophota bacterium]